MKKRLIALIVVCGMMLLTLTSCSAFNNIKDFFGDLTYIASLAGKRPDYNVNASLSYEFDETIKEQIEDRFARMEEIIKSNNDLRALTFITLYQQQTADLYYVSDQANLAFIAFSKDTSNEEASAVYEKLSNLYTEYSNRFTALYREIYESNLKDSFFSSWSEEEIQKALTMSDACGKEFEELTKATDAEIKRYQEMNQSSSSFLTNSAQSYYNIVQNNMKIAGKMGYSNYAEYAYKYVYDRDYTPGDAKQLHSYVKQYIVPLGNRVLQSLKEYKKLDTLTKDLAAYTQDPMNPEEVVPKLNSYYQALGNKLPASLEKWQESFYTSSAQNGLSNAYTVYLNYYGQPICFFGPDCQSLSTYVHEQGHFNAFYLSNSPIGSVDLCEVQSQGNEWLYLAYTNAERDKDYAKHLASYFLFDSICTVVLSTCCDAFEQYVYEHPELTAKDYDRVFIEQAEHLGAYEFLKNCLSIAPEYYWHYAIVSNSMYYLSYAVSAIPAIELYVMAEENFDTAAQNYLAISNVSYDAKFLETVTSCGFGSPFTEEPYKRIKNYFG